MPDSTGGSAFRTCNEPSQVAERRYPTALQPASRQCDRFRLRGEHAVSREELEVTCSACGRGLRNHRKSLARSKHATDGCKRRAAHEARRIIRRWETTT